ncbi:acyloxyacyl hydrolase [Pseudogemmobacter sonorensis]|uniref:acyloxyacyl hydrolase n=1 Tax=Pseudogemmobacter sonorensis TaxID=2989681 RepID=UPI0036BFC593
MNRAPLRTVLLLLATLAASTPAPVAAQELILGAGHSDFNAVRAENGAVISAEYRGRGFARILGAEAAFSAALDLHETGDAYLGAGLALRWRETERWFIEAGVMPGLFARSSSRNDLGGALHFRSFLGVGWRIDENSAISLAAIHKSNAHLESYNPGLNTLLLRWHRRF